MIIENIKAKELRIELDMSENISSNNVPVERKSKIKDD